jgi:hypothetical protein
MKWCAIGSAWALICGCSFAAVSAPPATPDHPCTTSLLSPVADTIGAVAALVIAGMAIKFYAAPDVTGDGDEGIAIAAGLAGAAFGFAAGYGFYEVNHCRDTRRAAP